MSDRSARPGDAEVPTEQPPGRVASETEPGLVRTVLGDVRASEMGITLSHEHVFIDMSTWFTKPTFAVDQNLVDAEPTLEELWWYRQNPNASLANLVLNDESTAIEETSHFAAWGGNTLIDLTVDGIGRDVSRLAKVARATGLHIVAGCGYYVDAAHPRWVREGTVAEIADRMIRDITIGVGDSGIRAGVIGEIGVSDPLTESEARVCRAAARAQMATGAAISVHNAFKNRARSATEVADILEGEGADLGRVVMGHMENSIDSLEHLIEIARRGCMVQFDMFGQGEFDRAIPHWHVGDLARVRACRTLMEKGHSSRLLLSQDVCYKIHLQRYGGYGYAHLLRYVIPIFEMEGVPRDLVMSVLTENPKRVFPLDIRKEKPNKQERA